MKDEKKVEDGVVAIEKTFLMTWFSNVITNHIDYSPVAK